VIVSELIERLLYYQETSRGSLEVILVNDDELHLFTHSERKIKDIYDNPDLDKIVIIY